MFPVVAVTVLYLIWYTIVIIVHLSYKRWNLFTVGPMYWWPPKKGFPQVRYKINALLQIRYGCLSKNHHHTQVLTCDLRILNSNKIRNLFTVAPMYRWSLKRGFPQSKYKRNALPQNVSHEWMKNLLNSIKMKKRNLKKNFIKCSSGKSFLKG